MASLTPGLPAHRGGMLAMLAAALFGVSTPLVQHFGMGLGAFSTAALLYAGAAAVGVLSRRRIDREARMVLVADQGRTGGAQLRGLLAVLLATMAWGVDNTLSRALAERDPRQVVMSKALLGATATSALAVAFGESVPWAPRAMA